MAIEGVKIDTSDLDAGKMASNAADAASGNYTPVNIEYFGDDGDLYVERYDDKTYLVKEIDDVGNETALAYVNADGVDIAENEISDISQQLSDLYGKLDESNKKGDVAGSIEIMKEIGKFILSNNVDMSSNSDLAAIVERYKIALGAGSDEEVTAALEKVYLEMGASIVAMRSENNQSSEPVRTDYEDGSYTNTYTNESGNTVIDRYDENGNKTNSREMSADGSQTYQEYYDDGQVYNVQKIDADGNVSNEPFTAQFGSQEAEYHHYEDGSYTVQYNKDGDLFTRRFDANGKQTSMTKVDSSGNAVNPSFSEMTPWEADDI